MKSMEREMSSGVPYDERGLLNVIRHKVEEYQQYHWYL